MICSWKLPFRISILPPNWSEGKNYGPCRVYFAENGIKILHGKENHDGKWWDHVSISAANRMPTFEELKDIKNILIGRDKKAIQIFPNEKEYINLHPYFLHIFHSDEDGLPDFTHEGGI